MKKISTTILLNLLFIFSTFSQISYNFSGPVNAQGPLLNTESTSSSTGWVMVHDYADHGGSSVNSWSSLIDIGFNFEFYGTVVDSFCVSKNYLLTFDKSVATTALPTSINDNSALPSLDLPDNTIAYQWDGFSTSLGSNDDVWVKTFGTAPNRQLWVKNFSYRINGSSFTYNFVVLEETTNNIYIVDARNGTNSSGSRTIGVQLNNTTAVQDPSSPNITATVANVTSPWPNINYYQFSPFLQVPNNVGVASIDSPSDDCGLTASETVQVTIENIGTSPQSNIPVMYSLNGGAPISGGTLAGPLAAGATATHTFTANLSAVQTHNLEVWTAHAGDTVTNNDTSVTSITNIPLVSSFPYNESFESGNGGWISGGTGSTWQLGAPSASVINSASDGSMSWVTNLTGNYNANEQSYVQGPCFDLSGMTNPEIMIDVWWEAENSWDGANLQSSIDGGATWVNVGSTTSGGVNWYNDNSINGFSGFVSPQDGWTGYLGAGSNGWMTASHDLTGLGGQSSVMLRIPFGSDGSGQGEGFAFDNIIIQEKPINNASVASIDDPFSVCDAGAVDSVEITLANIGGNTISNIPIVYSLNGGAFVSAGNFSGSITSGSTASYKFQVTFGAVGSNSISVATNYPSDPDNTNDTATGSITVAPLINTYPYSESFESGNGGWTSAGTNSSWELGTPANGTINSAGDGTMSWETNLTGDYNVSEQSFVQGPCFDFSGITNPEISLLVWWESETSWDGANLQSSTDGGVTWTNVGTTTSGGTNWYSDNSINGFAGFVSPQDGWSGYFGNGSNGWVTATHDLTGLGGQPDVRLRITFGSDGSGQGDGFAFDKIEIRDKPLNNLGIVDIIAPGDACGLGMETLTVAVENFGVANQNVYNVGFRVNGGAVITQSFTTDTVYALDTIHLTLDSLIDLSQIGVNNIEVWTVLAGDQDNSNDTLFATITHESNVITSFPRIEDHETLANASSGNLANGWRTTSTTGNFGWEIEDSEGINENSTSTGPFYDHTSEGVAGGKYIFMEASSGSVGEEDNYESPCIDLSPLTNPALEFWYHMYGSAMGSLHVEINSGGNWVTLQSIVGQQQTAGSDPWLKSTINLGAYSGQSVKIRFRGVKGTGYQSDMSLDDIRIFDVPLNDAGITAMDLPVGPVITAGNQNVEVSIKNYGLNTLTSATINWSVNGAAQSPINWTGSLATDAVSSNNSLGSFNFPTGLSNLVFYTSIPNGASDEETSNDTLEVNLCTPLSGTYSVGPTGDFSNIVDVVNALSTCGVSGPVTVNVMSGAGPFNGQVIFNAIAGASNVNTITFNGNGEEINHTASSTDKRIIGFDGAKHITLDNFVIKSGSPTYGYGVHFMNSSDSNTVSNCTIDLSNITSTTSSNSAGIIASGSVTSNTTDGTNTNYSSFLDNNILGGASGAPYQAFYLNGTGTGSGCVGNIITGNTCSDFYAYGVYMDEANGTIITDNDFSRPNRTIATTTQFITTQGKTENTLVERNEFHNSHGGAPTNTSTTYVLYSTSNDADPGDENIYQNNLIYDINNNGTVYAIYNFSSNGQHYYHNTISLDNTASTAGTTRGLYQTTTASNLEFVNNIISITRGGTGQKHGIYLNATGTTINSDYNDIYVNSAGSGLQYVGRYGTTNYADLANWQTANTNAYDQNSFDADPLYIDLVNDDLTPNQAIIDDVGDNLGISTDFFNAARDTTPDPGAIEFFVATNNLAALEITSPVEPSGLMCGLTASEQISLVVKNLGTVTVTSIDAGYIINGNTPVTETFGGLNIPFNGSDTLHFAVLADLSTTNTYNIDAFATIAGDTDLSNDTTYEQLTTGIFAPYFEDFESLSNEANGVLSNGWFGNQTTDPRWEAEDANGANENSTGTGPLTDHTLYPNAGGIYMFTETSSGTAGQEMELVSPCIDISGLANPFVRFWYHMHGSTMGDLFLDVSTDGGNTWEAVDSILGQQQAVQSDPWLAREVNLCNYTGNVRFQFRSRHGGIFTSDMAIDDFEVYDAPNFSDASVTLEVDPTDYAQTPLPHVPAFSFEGLVSNNGLTTNTNVTIDLTSNGSSIETANLGSMVDCGDDSLYVFSNSFLPSAVGQYNIDLTVSISETDANPGNNTSSHTIIVSDTIYARDDSSFSNGIGANGVPIIMGQLFEFQVGDTVTSSSFFVTNPTFGDSARVFIYNDNNGIPGTIIDSSTYAVLTSAGWYTVDFCNTVLSAGDYFFAVEQNSINNLTLGYDLNRFNDSTAFYTTGGGIWTPFENAGFPSTLLLRANLGHPLVLALSGTDSICSGDSSTIMATSGFNSYNWSTGDATNSITVMSSGTYTVTVTDHKGCTQEDSFAVRVNPAISVSILTSTNVDCNGNNTGSATALGSGGTSPYLYAWSNGSMTDTTTSLAAGTYTVTLTDDAACTATTTVTITEPTALDVSSTVDNNVSCNSLSDGGATASASGGTSPYTYSWSNGITTAAISGVAAGTYTVTVTDANGCTDTTSSTITEPATLIAASTVNSNISCNGLSDGSATASASGGTMPYTYAWNNGITTAAISGVTAGTYTVTVTDANGCTDTTSSSITEPTVLNASASVNSNVSCNGFTDGSISASGSGGTMPYTYLWSNSSTNASLLNVAAGTYTVTIIDANGCTATASDVITEPTALSLSSTVDNNVSCSGFSDGGATASASGGTMPYTYVWTNSATTASITGVLAGTYSVTVTDANGCTSTSSSTITEPNNLIASITLNTNASCNGFNDGDITASATGGTMPYTYAWSNGDVSANSNGLTAGTYTVTITDANGCSNSNSVTVTEPATLTLNTSTTAVTVFGTNDGAVDLTVNGGTMPYTYLWSNAATTEDITSLFSGTYTVSVTDANGCTANTSATVTEPGALNVVGTPTDATCNGFSDGSIDITVSGGVTPYTYNWSNSDTTEDLSNVLAGTYTVTVSDVNGASFTSGFTVSEPTTLVASSIVNSDASCNGFSDGGATASATGGTMPYTYLWSSSDTTASIANKAAGTYTVTVTDANSCTATSSSTISEPATLVASSIVNSDVSCNGFSDGAATASAVGGTSPYTYLWSNNDTTSSISNVSAGTYTVTVTDANGCTDTTSSLISEPATLSVTTSLDTAVSCNGFSDGVASTLTLGGTMPYSYAWSNGTSNSGISGVSAGTYTVTVTDANGCMNLDSVVVTEPAILVAASVVDSNVTCNGFSDGGATASGSGGTMPYTYSWSNSATTASITGVMAGTYTVTVTDANGCSDTSSTIIIEPATLLAASVVDSNVTCNGSSDGGATASATGGTMPYTYLWSNSATTASITGVMAGTYTVTVIDANGCTNSSSATITEPAGLAALTVVDSNVSCNGFSDGGATASATGGTMPYTYLWSNSATTASITGLVAGTYSVTVTDANGCTNSSSAMVTEPDSIMISGIVSDALCFGDSSGSITASASGGNAANGPSSLLITEVDPGSPDYIEISNVSVDSVDYTGWFVATSNSYTVINTANSLTWNLNGKWGPGAVDYREDVTGSNYWGNNLFYNSGSPGWVAIVDNNGNLADFMAWGWDSISIANMSTVVNGVTIAPGASNAWSGIGINSTCSNSYNRTSAVDNNDANDWTCVSQSKGVLNSGITLVSSGGTFTYDWSNGDTSATAINLSAGTYTVTVTHANGCTAVDVFTVNEPAAALLASTVADSMVSCNGFSDGGATASATGGTMPYTYLWSNSATTASITGVMAGTYTVTATDANGCADTSSVVITEPASLFAIVAIDSNISCNGFNDGGASVTATGGTSPYTYDWSNAATTSSITGLAAGTYLITVTDANGCFITDSVSLNQPTAISLNITLDSNVSCFGFANGGATATTSGGTLPYTYNWSNSATTASVTGLNAGNYYLTVTDANGCMEIDSVQITEPSLLVASAIVDSNATCFGLNNGGATASAVGGTMPYSYFWSNGDTTASIDSIAAGNYIIVVIDSNGCADSANVTITEPGQISDTLTIAACDSYTWMQNSMTYTMSGFYTDTLVSTGACDTIRTLDLTINTLDTTVGNFGDSLYANDPNASFQWLDCNNGYAVIAGATSASFKPSVSGSYAVVLTNGACIDTTACQPVTIIGIDDAAQKISSGLSIYPNPSTGLITIELSGQIDQSQLMRIFSMSGELVRELPLNFSSQQIDLTDLSEGVYFIRYRDTTKKIVLTN